MLALWVKAPGREAFRLSRLAGCDREMRAFQA